jgi:hypothetical protein
MYVVAGQLDIARACAKLICEINDSPYFDIDFFYEACGLERR